MTRKIGPALFTIEVAIPNSDRESLVELMIAGRTTLPWTSRELLIDAPCLYSHEPDVDKALAERFTPEWISDARACARYRAELLRTELQDEPNCEELLDGLDARSIFRRYFRREMRRVRIEANQAISRCWMKLLKHRPEYVERCPWRFFQEDRIWRLLGDKELLHAIGCTPQELAEKLDLGAMTQPDWDEVLKIAPELASRRPENDYDCCVE